MKQVLAMMIAVLFVSLCPKPATAQTPIARWTTVPMQRIGFGNFQVGVVAAHKDGIDRVDFEVDGNVTSVYEADQSWETQRSDWVWCYVLEIDPSSLDDGDVEVSATAYSTGGATHALETLTLRNNFGSSLAGEELWCSPSGSDSSGDGSSGNPYKTIFKAYKSFSDRNGATIYLKAGTYAFGSYSYPPPAANVEEWCTITRDPSATRSQVVIDSSHSSGLYSGHICLYEITIKPSTSFASGLRNGSSGKSLWFHDCTIEGQLSSGKVPNINMHNNSQWGDVYVSGCEISNVRGTVSAAKLWRGCTMTNVTENPAKNPYAVFNLEVTGCDRTEATGYTPAEVIVFRFSTSRTNCVIQHVYAHDNRACLLTQESSSNDFERFFLYDIGFIKNAAGAGNVNGFIRADLDHVLLTHVTWADSVWKWVSPNARTFSDCKIRNCWLDICSIVSSGSVSDLTSGITWDHINWEATASGSNVTPGSNLVFQETTYGLTDKVNGDLRLKTTANGYEHCSPIGTVPTGTRGPRNSSTPDVGAFVGSATGSLGPS